MINSKQCTIALYVDDNIISHVDNAVIENVINVIEKYFPGLVIERGKKLNFLWMELEFTIDRKVKIGVVQYLKGMIEEFEEEIAKYGEKLDRKYSSPAAKWLFAVNPDTKALDTSKEDICRRFLAKLLWVMKRARPNTEPTMGFLSSRVKQLDKDD